MSPVAFTETACQVLKDVKMDAEMGDVSQHLPWSKSILGLFEAFRANIHVQRIHILQGKGLVIKFLYC